MLVHSIKRSREELSRTREIFEKVDRKLKERAAEYRDVVALYKIVLGGADGGTWLIDFRQESIGVREQEGEAECTIETKDEHFVSLFDGKLSPENALLTGKVKVSGDILLAMRFGELLKKSR
jgi:putative sterol carrier protein